MDDPASTSQAILRQIEAGSRNHHGSSQQLDRIPSDWKRKLGFSLATLATLVFLSITLLSPKSDQPRKPRTPSDGWCLKYPLRFTLGLHPSGSRYSD